MKNNKTILVINRDDVLFNKGVDAFLARNHQNIDKIYYTYFFPPQANKNEYILKSFKIMGGMYFIKYILLKIIKLIVSHIPLLKYYFPRSSLPLLAKSYGIESILLNDVNGMSFLDELRAKKVRTILSITSQLYKKEIIGLPNLKIYNFHPSLLPNNKGRFPVFWALLKKESLGITCHEIDEKIDNGKIILQEIISTDDIRTVEQGMDIVLKRMGDFMNASYQHILHKKEPVVLVKEKSFYGATPSDADIKKYKKELLNKL